MNTVIDTYAIVFIIIVLLMLAAVVIILICFATIRRSFLVRREKQYQQAEKKVSDPLYAYLDDEIDLNAYSDVLQSRFEIEEAYQLVSLLIDNVKGSQQKKLRSLLELPKFRRYFFARLRSRKIMHVAQACMYFSQKGLIDKDAIRRMFVLQDHPYNVILYASTLALVSTAESETQDEALMRFLKRGNNASMAISDIIFKYHSNQSESDRCAQVLLEAVKDASIPDKNRAAVIIMLPGFGFYQCSDDLMELLRSEVSQDQTGILTAALIKVLNEFSDEGLEKEIVRQELWKSGFQQVRLEVVHFFSELKDESYLSTLMELAHDPDIEVRMAALNALMKIQKKVRIPVENFQADILPEWQEMKRSGEDYVDSL